MATDFFDSCWTCALEEEEVYEDDYYNIELNEPSSSSSRSLALSHRRSSVAFFLPLASCYLAKLLASSALELCQDTDDCNSTPRAKQSYKTQRVRYRYLKAPSTPPSPAVVENSVVDSKDRSTRKWSKRSLCTHLSRYICFTNKICCFGRRTQKSSATVTVRERGTTGAFSWIKSSAVIPLSTLPEPDLARSNAEMTDAATVHIRMLPERDAEKDCLTSLRTKTSLGDQLEAQRRATRSKAKSFKRRPKAKSSVQFFPAYQGKHV